MRSKSLTPLIMLVLMLVSKAPAQGYVEILPDEVKKPFLDRWETISKAIEAPETNEWAGQYYRDVSVTWGEEIVWKPTLGFAAYQSTCSSGPRAWVNYGVVVYRDGLLTVVPERGKDAPFVLDIPNKEFTAVRWGKQHWLVPTAKLAQFAIEINSRSGEEDAIGYLKWNDRDKHQSSLPDLPVKYRGLLTRPPIKASVVKLGRSTDIWDTELIINRGSADGVIEEMSFWLVGQKGIDVQVTAITVAEHTSVVRVGMSGWLDGSDKEIKPAIGWRFTSRMPPNGFRPG